ncbi:MAG: hypothetical protein JWR21_1198 [Herminiimonas sp.]|jgi:hypothetical protein|nr:hypothetical protein [Herminiimonas sp.]MDB5856142.1 hypothetical protein [Herminiimonas sp.]
MRNDRGDEPARQKARSEMREGRGQSRSTDKIEVTP